MVNPVSRSHTILPTFPVGNPGIDGPFNRTRITLSPGVLKSQSITCIGIIYIYICPTFPALALDDML